MRDCQETRTKDCALTLGQHLADLTPRWPWGPGPTQRLQRPLISRVVSEDFVDVQGVDDPGPQIVTHLGPVGEHDRATGSSVSPTRRRRAPVYDRVITSNGQYPTKRAPRVAG